MQELNCSTTLKGEWMGKIDRVEYGRIERAGIEGLRVSFFIDFSEDSEHADVYEFFDTEDVVYLVALIGAKIKPEYLMIEIRKRSKVTLH